MDWSHLGTAVLGYLASFAVEHFRHKGRRKKSKAHAEALFKHLHDEKQKVFDYGLSVGPAVVAQSTRLLLSRAADIQGVITELADNELTVRFLKYLSKLEELNEHVQAGHLGLVNVPSRLANEIYEGKD